jgi:hypothetical protein
MSDIILNLGENPGNFPYQKRPDKKKTEKFFKECVEAGIHLVNWNHNVTTSKTVRPSRQNKLINYKLYNGDIDAEEVERVVNPFRIHFGELPTSYRNYPLINPNIEILLGEERKRFFKPMFINVNEDAVSNYLNKLNDELVERTIGKIANGAFSKEQAEKEVAEFEKWNKYHFKDKGARMAGQVCDYLYRTLDLKEEFSRGFEDLLIAAEEIYIADIIAGEPVLRKANPLNIYTLRSGDSYKIEDADIIVEDGYISIGEVIDRYHDYLTDKEINALEKGHYQISGASADLFGRQLTHPTISFDDVVEKAGIGSIITATANDKFNFGGAYDSEGNIRVTRVLWKGMRRIGVKEYEDETGAYIKEFVPDGYEPDEERGEELKWIWVSEWNEGTRIGSEIYVKMGPREVQMRSIDNPSKCHPGIVGTVLNVNSSAGKSMLDNVKVYQYLYNAIMTRTEGAIAKYLGKVGTVNASLIPDKWSMDQFLYYMYTMNIKFEDPFNEGQEGAATGKLAGSLQHGSNSTEIGDAQFIQQHLMLLEFIQRRVDETTGITPQRKGAIANRETVGGVERSVMQSSHITEKWFAVHDNTRSRALLALVETAKVAWNNRSFKRNYVLDDGTIGFLDFDGTHFKTTELGIAITTDSEDMNMMQAMKQLSQHLVQNQAPLSLIMEMYQTKDPASLKKKLEQYEEQQAQQAQEAQKAEQEAIQAQLHQTQELTMMQYELEAEQKELDRELEQYKIDTEAEVKINVAQINAYKFQEDWDKNQDGIPDPAQIADQAIKKSDIESKHYDKQTELRIKENEFKRKADLEKRKLDLEEKKMHMEAKLQKQKDTAAMEREKLKAKTAIRNKVSGEK